MRDQSVWIYQWLPSCSSRINNGSLTHCMLGATMTTNRIVCPQFCVTVMADAREDFPTLSDEDKSVAILDLCASHPGVSNLIYSMYIQRCNLLR